MKRAIDEPAVRAPLLKKCFCTWSANRILNSVFPHICCIKYCGLLLGKPPPLAVVSPDGNGPVRSTFTSSKVCSESWATNRNPPLVPDRSRMPKKLLGEVLPRKLEIGASRFPPQKITSM